MSRLFSILLVGALSATSPLLPSEARADSSVRSVAVVKLGADTQATAGILAAIEWSIRRYHKNYKVKNLHDILNTSESESFSQNRLVEAKSFMKTGLQALRSGKVEASSRIKFRRNLVRLGFSLQIFICGEFNLINLLSLHILKYEYLL